MMKTLFLLALLLVPTLAFADGPVVKQSTCTVTWDAPQTSADASNLTDLAAYGVYVAATPAALAAMGFLGAIAVPAPATDPPAGASATWSCKALAPGQYYVQVDAVDTLGNRSGRSAVVPFVSQDDVPPQAPSGLRVGP